jgi:uncharacterized protein (DUF736 family)
MASLSHFLRIAQYLFCDPDADRSVFSVFRRPPPVIRPDAARARQADRWRGGLWPGLTGAADAGLAVHVSAPGGMPFASHQGECPGLTGRAFRGAAAGAWPGRGRIEEASTLASPIIANRRRTMPSIGRVTKQADGTFKGLLATLSIKQNIQFVKNRKMNESQPDFVVMAHDVEIGAAWWRTAISSGKDYLSISLAAPEFGNRTLYAHLGRAAGSSDENEFAIIWNPQD